MSAKHYNILWEDELIYNNISAPLLWWDDASIKKILRGRGFDLHKTIFKVLDYRGWCWVQRK